ncbi:MAG: ABC transporter ATP-binding protein, partial [Myxococcota bacterium]
SDPDALDRWVGDAAGYLGVEAEPVYVDGADIAGFVAAGGPALLRVGPPDAPRYLVLRAARGRRARLVAPTLREVRVPREAVTDALLAGVDPGLTADLDGLLDAAAVPARRRARARDVLLRERIAGVPVAAGWLLRLPPSASFRSQLALVGVPRRVAGLTVAHLATWGLGLAAWGLLGRGALEGRLDGGWLAAWGLLVLSLVPVRAAIVRAEGRLALDVGALLKQRLLVGALRLRPEEVRHQGMGQLLGRVLESEAVESAATGGAFFAGFALLELVLAAVVLALGAGGVGHAVLLGAWIVGTLLAAWGYARRRRGWSDVRLALTDDLVAAIVGHRTRLAQADPARWHDGEDAALARYVHASGAMDRAAVRLGALAPGGW